MLLLEMSQKNTNSNSDMDTSDTSDVSSDNSAKSSTDTTYTTSIDVHSEDCPIDPVFKSNTELQQIDNGTIEKTVGTTNIISRHIGINDDGVIRIGRNGYRFNRYRTVNCCKCFVLLIAILIFIVLIGSNDMIYAITNSLNHDQTNLLMRQEFHVVIDRGDKMSWMVFPGTELDSIIDILYIIAAGLIQLIIVFEFFCYTFDEFFSWKDVDFDEFFLGAIIFPLLAAIYHLFGNLHYQFYCTVGMLPEENCFWMFDYRSLIMGPAGLIGSAIIVILTVGIFYILFKTITCDFFFDKVTLESNNV